MSNITWIDDSTEAHTIVEEGMQVSILLFGQIRHLAKHMLLDITDIQNPFLAAHARVCHYVLSREDLHTPVR